MKEKVTYINEEYFCYTNEDSRIIVIFKKARLSALVVKT